MDLIDREYPTSDDKPPWFGMKFKQSVYSDAMLESLKRRYPQGANLRERKHMAAIEFLQQELKNMQASEAALIPKTNPTTLMPDIASHDHQHQRTSSPPYSPTSQLSPPNTMGEYHGRRSPTNTVFLEQPPTVSSNISGQEFVFSIANRPVVQRQRRKKMTAAEKVSYKQMRKIGACDSCKRQKAKVDSLISLATRLECAKLIWCSAGTLVVKETDTEILEAPVAYYKGQWLRGLLNISHIVFQRYSTNFRLSNTNCKCNERA